MELTPGQRKAAFTVIVLALAALGAFLVVSRLGTGTAASTTAGPARSPSPPAATSSQPPASAAPSVSPAAATPAATGVDIYRLLPFSQTALDRAVAVTEKFASQYGTYSYRESAASYVAAMRGLVTPELAATLARSYATPGVAQLRTQQQQVSSARGTVTSLRAFGPTSLTFVVRLVQQITERQGRSQQTGQYAITVTASGSQWQVSDIQLASAGNS